MLSPGNEVGGDMIVKVDPGHERSGIQDLQQRVSVGSDCSMNTQDALCQHGREACEILGQPAMPSCH